MGSVYAARTLGIDQPRVGLMNVGGEEQKGTEGLRAARDMLRDSPLINFQGYVEGRGVFDGEADVVITDGITGNVMLKLAEGVSAGIFKAIAREVVKVDPDFGKRFEPVVKRIYAEYDYHEYGGAPLLGVNGVCIISHGSSVGRTIANAIQRSRQFVNVGVNDAIVEALGAAQIQDEAA
jgi:phosphate acyltransferase